MFITCPSFSRPFKLHQLSPTIGYSPINEIAREQEDIPHVSEKDKECDYSLSVPDPSSCKGTEDHKLVGKRKRDRSTGHQGKMNFKLLKRTWIEKFI